MNEMLKCFVCVVETGKNKNQPLNTAVTISDGTALCFTHARE